MVDFVFTVRTAASQTWTAALIDGLAHFAWALAAEEHMIYGIYNENKCCISFGYYKWKFVDMWL